MTPQFHDHLETRIYDDRGAMGEAAALFAASVISQACAARGEARVVFACAPSQNEFLAALVAPDRDGPAMEWNKVVAFHMDEYVGLTAGAEQSFRHYLRTHLFERLPTQPRFHEIRGEAPSLEVECARYSQLVGEKPIDLVCLGIGENGHIAFNDPPVADFRDAHLIKVVTLDEACRRQQVNDGCFASFDLVPTQALTLTIPALVGARHVSVVVPGPRKAQAVRATLQDPVSTACPASILRTHPHAVLHLDRDAASLLPQ
ncbi:MAG: glucosamine-6-phosphate deaminase [Chthoniobacter sp.]|jgi:glucosamine-6-phosphate deaminase|nr:glucosamine-6-phosphate deaminase [Chthoniobacter sp.]